MKYLIFFLLLTLYIRSEDISDFIYEKDGKKFFNLSEIIIAQTDECVLGDL